MTYSNYFLDSKALTLGGCHFGRVPNAGLAFGRLLAAWAPLGVNHRTFGRN